MGLTAGLTAAAAEQVCLVFAVAELVYSAELESTAVEQVQSVAEVAAADQHLLPHSWHQSNTLDSPHILNHSSSFLLQSNRQETDSSKRRYQ